MPTSTLTPIAGSPTTVQPPERIHERSQCFARVLLQNDALKQLCGAWVSEPHGIAPEDLHPATRLLMEQAATLPTAARPPRSQTKAVLFFLHRTAVSLEWLHRQHPNEADRSLMTGREILAVVHPLYLPYPATDWQRIEHALRSTVLQHIVWRATCTAIGPEFEEFLHSHSGDVDKQRIVVDAWTVDLWEVAERVATEFAVSPALDRSFDPALQTILRQFDSDSRYIQIPGHCPLGPVDWPVVSKAIGRLATEIAGASASVGESHSYDPAEPSNCLRTDFEIREASDPKAAAAVLKLLRSCDRNSELTLVSVAAHENHTSVQADKAIQLSKWHRQLLRHTQDHGGLQVDFGCIDGYRRLHLLVRCDDHESQSRLWRRLLDASTTSLHTEGIDISLAAAIVHICNPSRVDQLEQLFELTERTLSASLRPGVNSVKSLSMI